ncbi:MAG: hypothetical protein K2W82_17090 [Candidatus Obscuribacterales bacterium]|nr:hypothetical protein [Candidatus Obscuribacterales bacterium]
MGLLILVLGVFLALFYVSPQLRDWVCNNLGINYNPTFDFIVLLGASFALSSTIGGIPSLIVLLIAFVARRSSAY